MRPIKLRRNGDSCIIRWTFEGERYSITWGSWDDPIEKGRLEFCARLIYQDCLSGYFDISLNKYRLWLQGVTHTGNGNGNGSSSVKSKLPPLIQLLQERIEELYNSADDALLKLLRKYGKLISTPDDAKDLMKWMDARGLKPSTRKRYLAIMQVLRRDLFKGIEVKIGEKPKAKPFTREEVRKIIDFLKESQHYNHYHDFVLFLFNTGCRISEAIGLLWRDVDLTKREIHIYEVLGRFKGSSSNRERRTTKTGKYRIVPINNTVYQMLVKRPKGAIADLIFTSPTGKVLDDHNISQRCWRKTLKALGINHRPLYNTRHTFVSHCVDSGMTVPEVAAITGHDPKVLLDHYLGSVKKPHLPEL